MTRQKNEQTIAEAFTEFLEVTRLLSDPEAGLRTPAGKTLLAGGDATVRYMFISGASLTIHDMAILTAITGANPVGCADAGSVASMEIAWRAWAREHLAL